MSSLLPYSNLDVRKVSCPVIGGHSGVTILPVISQCSPQVSFPQNEREKLTARIQNAGTEVVEAKAGAPNGVERNIGIGKLNEYEIEMLKIVIPELKKNIKRGKEFAATFKPT
ncbi:unnamed protein product [Echinostoma caproni]|uniref:Ldh_1_C domain-containing protein n=1 Tax=Echinostoma caproni TaxID=27848 RepID=A0A183AMF9_9TREM|nr:unnamed protein product [Echinostoma caproni]